MMEAKTELSASFTEEAERELARLRSTPIGRRITALEMLLGDMDAAVPRELKADAPRGARPGTGVSEAKLNAVRKYMQVHGEARQVDLTNDLEENSGSISLALRALAAQGEVVDTGKVDRKAKVWRWVGPPLKDDNNGKRATVVDVGEGVREGRRVDR